MNERNRILILYANYGEGHKMAAKAIEANLKIQLPEADIRTADFLGDTFPISDWIMRKLYLQTFSWAKPIYKQLYYRTKDFTVDSFAFSMPSSLLTLKLEQYIEDFKPSLVISTFPSITGILAKTKEKGRYRFTLYCVLTDYVAHSQWLYHSVDRYFVPTEELREDLIRRGIPDANIQTTGIPVMPKFETRTQKSTLLEKWGLSEKSPIVLISAGAFGVINIKKACEQLLDDCPDVQFLVVCGRNEKLYQQLSQLPKLITIHYTEDMHELMQLSDLFITKAGGLSISEAIMSELPMILFKSQPGQETENVKFLIRQRVAKRVKSTEELSSVVLGILNDNKLWTRMKTNIKELRNTMIRNLSLTDCVIKDLGRTPNEVDVIRLREKRLYEI
ncbi:glycosyltransferase [Pullulanibacillus sp. KACC 23026]|uniref:MGDG synthase family glycosyltransferase n=1 Tax=Pullulanibacillus sp. KACC 23026 TaxID=3028315 RepID=UPI0023B04C74|nr:glycosyltransferase [Pullulanibacillus sp. KACC 23026]WEG11861.1 glycosyltransferase [Pullulanibacillus sp. KACC 23026]